MFKKKDDIRTFIVVVIVCALCLVIALIFNNKKNYDMLQKVDDYDVFFHNVSIINNYLVYLSNNDEALKLILDKKYIKGDIIDNNKYSVLSSFEVTSMEYVKINKDFIYYVQGKIYNNVYDSFRELVDDNFRTLIIMDTSKNTYAIYPIDDNVVDVVNDIKWISIKKNEYNIIGDYNDIDKEDVCTIYFSNFMNYVYNDINHSYELLSDEMKKTYTDKNKYINDIYDSFSSLSTAADMCKLSVIDDKNVYTVVDTNKNTYMFTESSIMNYKVDFYLNKNE